MSEAFTGAEVNEIISVHQSCQLVEVTNVSGTIPVPHHQALILLMIGIEMVIEISVIRKRLPRLMAREYFSFMNTHNYSKWNGLCKVA
jgi:hypothetical protein